MAVERSSQASDVSAFRPVLLQRLLVVPSESVLKKCIGVPYRLPLVDGLDSRTVYIVSSTGLCKSNHNKTDISASVGLCFSEMRKNMILSF